MHELMERLQSGLPERYRLERELGRGGMSTVYLAQERHPNRRVAIKVLHPELTVRIGRERFLREIDFVSNLTHPHIVPIYAAGEASGLLYFVMPYVEGETLADLLRQARTLAPKTALRIASQIAQALAYAHRRNIVHRDIKPENILLHDSFALVTDFGVARAIRAAGDETVTQAGLTVGTPAYMSPEQAAGKTDLDARADIYGLGCLLYEMLTGSAPFGKGPVETVLNRQLTESPRPAREIVPSLPVELDALLMEALAKDPAGRPASADAFAHRLEQLAAGLTSGAIPAAGHQRARWRTWLLGAVTLTAVVAVVAMLSRRGAAALPLITLPEAYGDSVAVLMTENMTGHPELDGLADALTYGAISRLQDVPGLKVPSYLSSRRFDPNQVRPNDVADSLHVRLVVAAQLRAIGDELRLDAELIDGQDGVSRGSRSWLLEGPIDPGMVRSMVRRLVELVTSGASVGDAPGRIASSEGPAAVRYRLGRTWWGRRTAEGIRRALALFGEAIDLDSTYAPAYTGLSSAYSLAVFYRYDIGMSGYEAAARALASARRAIALDPLLAEGYAARGFIVSRGFGPTEQAAADYIRALELSPSEGQALAWSGAVMAQQGQTDEALKALRLGVELRPYEPAPHLSLALGAFALGEWDLAVRESRRATDLEPRLVEARALEGRALLLAGRVDECLALAFGPHDAIRATCLHAAGARDIARAIVDSISAAVLSERLGDTVYTAVLRADGLASYYSWIGNADTAFFWADYAFERSPLGIDRRILESPLFDTLRRTEAGRARLRSLTARIWPRVERLAAGR